MRKYILTCLLGIFCLSITAQSDASLVSISAVQPDYENIPEEARANLETTMQRIITSCGVANSAADRFIMTAHMDVITREVNTAGMIVQRMEMTFVIGDVIDEKIYGTTTINAVGIGATETKCLIKAFQGIKSNNEKLANLVNTAKDKILAYYTDNCHLVLQDAERMVGMQQYNDALAILVGVPQACEECYTACQTKAVDVYKLLIDHEGKQLIQNARSAWLVKRDYDCAEKALDILAKVNPHAPCQSEANALIADINKQLRKIEAAKAAAAKAQWDFKLKQYEDKMELERQKQEGWNTLARRFGKIEIGYKKEKAYKIGSSSK
jgi:hypothetical protein